MENHKGQVLTGYFGNLRGGTLVHLVRDGRPLCGSRIGSDSSFQWSAKKPVKNYVECRRCADIYWPKKKTS